MAVLDSIGRVTLYKMNEQEGSVIHQDPNQRGSDESAYQAMDLSPDGRLVAICSPGFVRVFDVEKRTVKWQSKFTRVDPNNQLPTDDTASTFYDVSFSPNGERLALCGKYGSVHVFNASSGALQLSHEPGTGAGLAPGAQGVPDGNVGFDGRVAGASFSPDGGRLALIKENNDWNEASYVEMFDLETAQALWRSPKQRGFVRVAFSPDGRSVASCGHKMRVFNALSGAEIANGEIWPRPFPYPMTHVSYSPYGSCVATCYANGDIAIFRTPHAPEAGAQIARGGEGGGGGGGGGGGAGVALQKLQSLHISFS